jgi:hypothetical protein
MENYLVKLIFEVVVDGRHDHFDAQLRVFRAPDVLSAIETCNVCVREEEGSFVSRAGNEVTWRFVGISFITALVDIKTGGLVESVSLNEDHTSYRRYVQARDAHIRTKTLSLV